MATLHARLPHTAEFDGMPAGIGTKQETCLHAGTVACGERCVLAMRYSIPTQGPQKFCRFSTRSRVPVETNKK